ncbi:MAG: hypothetical protein IJ088_14065 [Clostridia bacterium]|nr:hypothetical protein [Clostridia bacterium]
MQFTLQQQISHLRQRCVKAEKENAELRAGVNLDKFMDKCKQEAQKQNTELNQTVRKLETVVSTLRKEKDSTQKQLSKVVSELESVMEKYRKLEATNKEIVSINRRLTRETANKDQQIERKDEIIQKLRDELVSKNVMTHFRH